MLETKNASAPVYAFGRTQGETQRLMQQAQRLEPTTRQLFERAGITRGMKVLDIGCGAGDVSLLAARLVGPSGQVVGVDNNTTILELAQERAREAGLSQVSFRAGDFHDLAFFQEFDAVVGRYVLLYVANLVVSLRALVQYVRPGGIVALQEPDMSLSESLVANSIFPPLYRQFVSWLVQLYQHTGSARQMGFELANAFCEVGLARPQMQLNGVIVHAEDTDGYAFLAETLRSCLSTLIQHGITTEEQADVNTFARRLQAETQARSGFLVVPVPIGIWAKLPDAQEGKP